SASSERDFFGMVPLPLETLDAQSDRAGGEQFDRVWPGKTLFHHDVLGIERYAELFRIDVGENEIEVPRGPAGHVFPGMGLVNGLNTDVLINRGELLGHAVEIRDLDLE